MSATGAVRGAELEAPPEYELDCLYDDCDDPSELTIFSPTSPGLATEWVTADASSAVPLDRDR
jgi:hypothetical protein